MGMDEFLNDNDSEKQDIMNLLQQLDNLINGRPNSFITEESFEQIIEYYNAKEFYKKALYVANIACEQYPYSSALLIQKADLLLESKKYHEAILLLDKAVVMDKLNINIYILKTEALLALDLHDEAVQTLNDSLALFEGDEKIDLLFDLADVYDDYEDFDKVFECLKMILEMDSNNQEALYKICFWTDFTGRNAESIELHNKIIDESPYNELAWFNLATAYQGLKLYEKAIDAYKYALVIEENFDYAYRNMADALIRLKRYKEAIEALEKVIELSKPEDIIYEAIGFCYEKLKNNAQARFYYRRATHLNPENSNLFYKVALTYYKENNWNACMKQLLNAQKAKKVKPEVYLLMGECYLELNQIQEALYSFFKVVKMKPKSLTAWEALIIALYKVKDYEEASSQIELGKIHFPNKPVFLYYQAAILMGKRKTKEAIVILENALQVAPRLFKKFLELQPNALQLASVANLIAKYKKKPK